MVGFNIAEFSSKINERGTIQNNKFLVKISKPTGSTDYFSLSPYKEEDLIFRAASIEIPGVLFESTNSHRYGIGPQQKTPRNPNFNDISISFIEDERNAIWKFFSSWINQIFNFDSDRMYVARYKSEYISPNFEIEVSNNKGIPVNSIILTEAFPSSLGNVSLSWNDKNNLMMVKVGFSFTDWYWQVPEIEARGPRQRPIINTTPGLTTNRVVPTPNPSAPEYSSGTEASTRGGPRNPADTSAARVARQNGGASGLELRPEQQ
jgi:hypothetical protein